MSDNPKEAEEKMEKAIFISADCWLCVFDLLPAYQLGLGISTISRRFDIYVSEHFKTRNWTLALIRIRSKIGENGTKEMEIVNSNGKAMPIPKNPLPKKIMGFKRINIFFIDKIVITFLRRFHQLFAASPINLTIITHNDQIAKFLLRNILPLLGENIHGLELSVGIFHRFRQFVPSILSNYPSLRFVSFTLDKLFAEFPCDDSAAASDGQAVAKWLFTPLQSNVPKVFKCALDTDGGNWMSRIEGIKAAFASASSPTNFIIVFWFLRSSSVVPFVLTNKSTREQLALKSINNRFLLVRHPIARDESKWTKWEEEAIGWQFNGQWNKIEIQIYNEDEIGKGLLNPKVIGSKSAEK
ncbi:hypothetical protein niasHT_005519 [Heterodera trifolii]|uniref:Uncharacterized protein n=1 Tax=Heterodera trifolii TaxID=157864 RepID=A0ABD2LT53_9BILA